MSSMDRMEETISEIRNSPDCKSLELDFFHQEVDQIQDDGGRLGKEGFDCCHLDELDLSIWKKFKDLQSGALSYDDFLTIFLPYQRGIKEGQISRHCFAHYLANKSYSFY